jgi:hypothetical protein
MHMLLSEDRSTKLKVIAWELDISWVVCTAPSKTGSRKVYTWWVPNSLTDGHKACHMEPFSYIWNYAYQGQKFLQCIVTRDGAWFNVTSKTEKACIMWKHPSFPPGDTHRIAIHKDGHGSAWLVFPKVFSMEETLTWLFMSYGTLCIKTLRRHRKLAEGSTIKLLQNCQEN